MSNALLTKAQLRRHIRRHVGAELYDETDGERQGTAIYTLADPRDIRFVRYVGQTSAPRKRFVQHLNTARLWLPEEIPWWVKSPQLRPLYEWIRELYRDECRLPTMVVYEWVERQPQARIVERTRIYACLQKGLPLLNVEAEILERQIPLI